MDAGGGAENGEEASGRLKELPDLNTRLPAKRTTPESYVSIIPLRPRRRPVFSIVCWTNPSFLISTHQR